ncbi:hypothetical protein N7474_010123 [Penicillium riverlandense]|uniref:uncharacterized protein n=1 Tax=Penicillium riverlandense TaxID=1903569 RepID=UPI00254915AE|nr:uncharacterized protein N7474_010115 [Penicillium riverlandense]XP_057049520.1 uncharacterized protein N7474_010123 [Penicillium riverlandense]KAJ5808846.1 hypothetical protein N7474_010115 [Penicillium riverlandense]KAJ5808854.1 hypothetical protein N7474_010123 [Penicillium riverlandense]
MPVTTRPASAGVAQLEEWASNLHTGGFRAGALVACLCGKMGTPSFCLCTQPSSDVYIDHTSLAALAYAVLASSLLVNIDYGDYTLQLNHTSLAGFTCAVLASSLPLNIDYGDYTL